MKSNNQKQGYLRPDITAEYIRENERVQSLPIMGELTAGGVSMHRHSPMLMSLQASMRNLRSDLPRYLLNRLRFHSAYRDLKRHKGSGRGKRALVLGNGPSQGFANRDILGDFKRKGNDLFVVNSWNVNDELLVVGPTHLVISDPRTLKSDERLGSSFTMEQDLHLAAVLHACPEIHIFCPMPRIVQMNALFPRSRVTGFTDEEIRISGNISPVFPRGYVSMTLFKALALAIYCDYDKIFVLGMDNTYPRNLYCDVHNRLMRVEYYGDYQLFGIDNDVARELFELSKIFDDLKLFARRSPFKIMNLDPYSLTDAFQKVPTIEAGLSSLIW